MATTIRPLKMGQKSIDSDDFTIVTGAIGGSAMNPVSGNKNAVKKPDFQILSNIVEYDQQDQGYETSGATKLESGITDSISGTSHGFFPYNLSLFTGKTINFDFTGDTQFISFNGSGGTNSVGTTAITQSIFSYQLYKHSKEYIDPKLNYKVSFKGKTTLHPSPSTIKQDVRLATTSDISDFELAPNIIDGIATNLGDRVLVKSQIVSSENGIYTVKSSGGPSKRLVRSPDWDTTSDIVEGAQVFVTNGTVHIDITQILTTKPPYKIDDTNFPIRFSATTDFVLPSISADTLSYVVDEVEGRELNLYRGNRYVFDIDTEDHPFYISKSSFGMGLSAITSGVSENFIEKEELIFEPNESTPDTVFYASEVDSNMGGKINIFTGAFNDLVFEKEIPHSGFTGSSPTLTDNVPNSIFEDKGQYIIKPFYSFSAATLTGNTLSFEKEITINKKTFNLYERFTKTDYKKQIKGFADYFFDKDILSKLTGITFNPGPVLNDKLSYRRYDSNEDNYFVTLQDPAEPLFNFSDLISGGTFEYVSEDFTIGAGGQTRFILSNNPIGDVQVNVNGLTFKNPDEWTGSSLNSNLSDNRIVDLIDTIFDESGDTINVSYVRGSDISQPFTLESTQITGITTGATNTQTAEDKVFFNSTESKYEYYLDQETPDSGNLTVIKNGLKLSEGIDYTLSTTNKNRIIFLTDQVLEVNDVILVYYLKSVVSLSGTTGITITRGSIQTRAPLIEWTIPAPSDDSGQFQVDLVDVGNTGYSFTNEIHYSATTRYSGGQENYSVLLPSITGSDQTFIYRVVNDKYFTTIKGDVISARTISVNVKIDTFDRIIDQY